MSVVYLRGWPDVDFQWVGCPDLRGNLKIIPTVQ
jgi:hypothetical protein